MLVLPAPHGKLVQIRVEIARDLREGFGVSGRGGNDYVV